MKESEKPLYSCRYQIKNLVPILCAQVMSQLTTTVFHKKTGPNHHSIYRHAAFRSVNLGFCRTQCRTGHELKPVHVSECTYFFQMLYQV
jgi:hypothetical protein